MFDRIERNFEAGYEAKIGSAPAQLLQRSTWDQKPAGCSGRIDHAKQFGRLRSSVIASAALWLFLRPHSSVQDCQPQLGITAR